ncbi:GntR family transcriptional regulator [Sphingomonas sp. Sphisp140]|uniref:GntR family transcriptional regulator n=1 Tax=unclassified Sphingomonas TaxID=196159 RepID=UPI0039AF3AFF
MSPGATFERVYRELKRMLVEGELPLGTPIEPAIIGKQIASSITPIRDALHRLTGERLVEAPNHNGFRVPLPTEAGLRDLYSWNGLVLELVAKRAEMSQHQKAVVSPRTDADIATSTATLFLEIAHSAGSSELTGVVSSLNDRLAIFRAAENSTLRSTAEEFLGLLQIIASGDRRALTGALKRYHRRRIVATADIMVLAAGLGSSDHRRK